MTAHNSFRFMNSVVMRFDYLNIFKNPFKMIGPYCVKNNFCVWFRYLF